ncbi:MAG: WYL domain-containing protein [Actinomycetota bacterium]|nr:WYL domain-containing protein [Actinomycetota bacterium]
MSRAAPADERLRRLLALVPWVAGQDGPRIEEVCSRFGCTEDELLADLGLLFLSGVHPFTPDTLVDVVVEEGRVWIRFADWFARPLRLTPAEGLALVAAGAALLAVPGTDPEGPLARALAKVAAVLGVDPDEAVGVELGAAPPEVLATVQEASSAARRVEIEYYSFGRDAWTRRVIEPHQVYNAAGQWYVAAWCDQAAGDRIFRVDRMRSARALQEAFERRPAPPAAPSLYSPRPDDPVVVLELPAAAAWVAEQYPNEGVEALEGGGLRVRLRVSERAWLERLLLRLGPTARVVEGDAGVARRAAGRVAARYAASVGTR